MPLARFDRLWQLQFAAGTTAGCADQAGLCIVESYQLIKAAAVRAVTAAAGVAAAAITVVAAAAAVAVIVLAAAAAGSLVGSRVVALMYADVSTWRGLLGSYRHLQHATSSRISVTRASIHCSPQLTSAGLFAAVQKKERALMRRYYAALHTKIHNTAANAILCHIPWSCLPVSLTALLTQLHCRHQPGAQPGRLQTWACYPAAAAEAAAALRLNPVAEACMPASAQQPQNSSQQS